MYKITIFWKSFFLLKDSIKEWRRFTIHILETIARTNSWSFLKFSSSFDIVSYCSRNSSCTWKLLHSWHESTRQFRKPSTISREWIFQNWQCLHLNFKKFLLPFFILILIFKFHFVCQIFDLLLINQFPTPSTRPTRLTISNVRNSMSVSFGSSRVTGHCTTIALPFSRLKIDPGAASWSVNAQFCTVVPARGTWPGPLSVHPALGDDTNADTLRRLRGWEAG